MSEKINRDFEESEEPSVLSSDPDERKLARRLRIQKRIEALKRLDGDEEEDAVEQSLTEKQIIESAELLEKLLTEGNEVITNVRIANDARELERRKSASEIRMTLLKHLDESARECQQRYEIINERWATILQSNDPLDIKTQMDMQKDKCDEVLAKKDAVIEELKMQLRRADDEYMDDQSRQKTDISLLIERIENQMGSMENLYDRELELVVKSLESERETLVSGFRDRWEALYRQQEDEDLAGDSKRDEIIAEYEQRMDKAMSEHDEEYRARKIQLESECQALQQHVQRTKAMCLLNAEKLAYNYTVLKNREDENSIVKNQQKRKINRLQAIISALQKNYCQLEESTKSEIDKLSSQITKTHTNITELEEKSMHFTRVNEKQYLDIWQMNDDNVAQLINKIFTIDQMIHERILGILWEPPKHTWPRKEDLTSYRIAMEHLAKNQKQQGAEKSQDNAIKKLKKSLSEVRLEKQILNNILKQISNSSDYFVESKLQELISHRSEEEKTIIKLDNVFQALSISSPEEIDILLDFFLPYSHCPKCSAHDDANLKCPEESLTDTTETSCCSNHCEGCNVNVKTLIASVENELNIAKAIQIEANDEDDVLEHSFDKTEECSNITVNESSKCARFKCSKGHVLEIQAACVTKALKEMITKCNSDKGNKILSFEERLKETKCTISRNLSLTDVKDYWSNYRDIFTVQKEQLWNAVLIGLNKYHEALKNRHNLWNEKNALKKQNLELQRLLETHTSVEDNTNSFNKTFGT
ncbi:dynein regulatory complex protein 1 [Phymastichus coffea]|uniref:dynein regulatory complex protein 1 n=1 Tax=Phymastichus coffea TaxID=108790 RepID=UPI00273BC050|nr:dynein regulatory complex protein 1 [Phymastichus coffea]